MKTYEDLWRLFQEHVVCTKFDIYLFINVIYN